MAAGTSDKSITEAFYQKLGKLHFQDGLHWIPLPSWAHFYLELGAILGLRSVANEQLAIALAVPSRTYVATLIAAGCIQARAALYHKSESLDRHVEWLRQLAPDTPVLIRHNDRRIQGKFKHIVHSNGRVHYMVQTDSGAKTTTGYPPDEIHPLEKEVIKLPKSQIGRARQEMAPLVTALLEKAASSFYSHSQLDCILIGIRSEIRKEIEGEKLGLPASNLAFQQGVLLDILRPKHFLPPNSAYRSDVRPASNSRMDTSVKAPSAHLVILDGSLSYLNQRHVWQKGHKVFVLDQTESQFEAAVAQVNQEYYRRSNQGLIDIKLPLVPPGVEVMPFEVNS